MISTSRALIYLYVVSLLWGLTGPLGTSISLQAISLVWWRIGICSVILLPFIFHDMRRLARINTALFRKIIAAGLVVSLHWVVFYQSIRLSNIAIATVCLASTSFFVCFVEYFMYRKRILPEQLVQSLLIILSFIIIFKTGASTDIQDGLILGIISAILNAVYYVINEHIMKEEVHPNTVVGIQFLTTFVLFSVVFAVFSIVPFEQVFPFAPDPIKGLFHFQVLSGKQDIIIMAVLTLVCTLLPYNLFLSAYTRTSAFMQSMILNLEPVVAIVVGIVFFKEYEVLGVGFYIGVLVLMGLIGFQSWKGMRESSKSVVAESGK